MALVVAVLLLAFVVVPRLRGAPVDVVELKSAPLSQSVVVSGRMANESRVYLGATITGRVANVKVREGALVKAGDALVLLEDAELSAAARQAVAALRTAEARLDSQTKLAAPTAAQSLTQARVNRETAERERERAESLFQKGFIGQSRLDEARRAADVAKAQLATAEAQAEANQRGAELAQAVARVAEAGAAAELAKARLAQTRVLAPADGLVLERTVEPGQIVQAGTRLIEVSIKGPPQLIAQVDEKFLGQLRVGQTASVAADAFPNEKFMAKVLSISPTIDVQRGSVEVKFSLDKPPSFLRNDMTLSIDIETARREGALALPADVLRADGSVLVVESGRTVARAVKLGIRSLSTVEVVEGLRAGEQIVLDRNAAPGVRVSAKVVTPAVGAATRSEAFSPPMPGR
jgi:HlyD family secretion protein